jgi:hypothetical protein
MIRAFAGHFEFHRNICIEIGRLQKWLFCSTIGLYRQGHWLFLLNDRRLDVLLMIREDHTFD